MFSTILINSAVSVAGSNVAPPAPTSTNPQSHHPPTLIQAGLNPSNSVGSAPVAVTGPNVAVPTTSNPPHHPTLISASSVVNSAFPATAVHQQQQQQTTNPPQSHHPPTLIQTNSVGSAPVVVTGPNVAVPTTSNPSHHPTLIPASSVVNAAFPTAAAVHQQPQQQTAAQQQQQTNNPPQPHHPPTLIQTNSVGSAPVAVTGANVAASTTSNPPHHPTLIQASSIVNAAFPTGATVHQQQQQQQQQTAAQQQQFQRLKVEDALSYLDQVKFKFNDQPQVYNDFLDIMKEFKSQSIDTPGVIQRVSNLFKGHPELIVGFNTFLPPGYKIEIHANDQVNVSMPNSANVVLVSTNPNGGPSTAVTTSTIVTGPGVGIHQQISGNLPRNVIVSAPPTASNVNLHQQQQQQPTTHQSLSHPQAFSSWIGQTRDSANSSLTSHPSNAAAVTGLSQSRAEPPQPPQSGPTAANQRSVVGHPIADVANSRTSHAQQQQQQHHPQSNSSSQNMPGSQQQQQQPGSQPVEFNHAINYVNKIKNRFQAQPEVYKQFLDILQNYQKEQRTKDGGPTTQGKLLTESEVFSKVAKLFQNQEDLLQEFSQFLPDAGGGGNSSASVHAHHNSNLLSASAHSGSNAINSSSNSAAANYNMQAVGQSAISFGHSVSHHEGTGSPYGTGSVNSIPTNDHSSMMKKSHSAANSSAHSNRTPNSSNSPNNYPNSMHRVQKRPGSVSNSQVDQSSSQIPVKRSKISSLRDSNLPETSKYFGDLVEYAFFDKLRAQLNSSAGYENFLRCLVLYNNEIFSRSELVQMVSPIFHRCPDLLKRFKEMLRIKEGGVMNSLNNNSSYSSSTFPNSYSSYNNSYYGNSYSNSNNHHLEGLSQRVALIKDRLESEYVELDFNSCKRYGVSYRTIPKNSARMECSGRTPLCHEVLNDTLVSFPSWSEDSTFVSSRKTQFEEYIYRCEDERYELDHVLETNLATIRVFDTIMKKLDRMSAEEKNNFRLDDCLGGRSEVIHHKAIRRIYGDKASSVIEGLKNSPASVVPIVYRRLMAKEEEWREAQKHFNKLWREQLEKYYLKSLDHQGINFKQNDIKNLRTKSMLNEIENIFDDRQNEQSADSKSDTNLPSQYQPHLVFVYPDKSMIEVACNLIIHHVKRQTSIHKEDKQKIKQLMRHFIPDLFATPRGELSDDEFDEDDKNSISKSSFKLKSSSDDKESVKNEEKPDIKHSSMLLNTKPDEEYSLFFVNDYWYYFFRLHYILCERLSKMHKHSVVLAAEEARQKKDKENSPSTLLRLRNNLDICADDYFSALVDMVKQVLDGNLDSTQYEDTLREMFGIHAYISFTLDKVVSYIVRQLQHIVGDEVALKCKEMYLEALKSGSAGGMCMTASQRHDDEAVYQKNAEQLMSEEHCFKLVVYKDEGKITFELLASNEDEEESANEGDEESNSTQSSRTLRSNSKNVIDRDKWNDDVSSVDMEAVNEKLEARLKQTPLFLRRSARKYKCKPTTTNTNDDSDQKDAISGSEKTASAGDNKISDDKTSPKEDPDKPEVFQGQNDPQTECQFNLNNFKSVVVVQKESMLYRRYALAKARKSHQRISQCKSNKFSKWHSVWVDSNCSQEQKSECDAWLSRPDK